jgi:FTR1 family protein
MFESRVVTLREGVEAALIVAIILAYIRKIGRPELTRSVFAGLVTAIAASVAGAIVFRNIRINEEEFEGWTMLVASLFITSMVIWMWRTAGRLKGEIESRVGEMASRHRGAFSIGIFAFVFLMVAREGIETVLLLSAVQLNTSSLMSFIGGVVGLLLALLFGIFFVKGSIRINLKKFFSVTSIILLIVAAQLFVSGLHELSEAMVLPSSEREMAIIGPIVKSQAFFYIIVLALTIFLILWQRQKTAAPVAADANPAERRKALFRSRQERLWAGALALVGIASIVLITAQFVYSMNANELSPPEIVFNRGTEIRVPVSQVDDGKLHRFAYQAGDNLVRFIMIKLPTGTIGVGLDACQICGDKGYFQQGEDVICKNCTAAVNPVSIGESGGCNPIPLESSVIDGAIVVPPGRIEEGAVYFSKTEPQD